MGAFTGAMTFSTFRVKGEVEPDFRETFIKGIQREAFSPLTADDEEDESVGWCAIDHPFDVDLDYDKVFYNAYINLGLRIDKWRIPAPLFKAFFTDAERQHLAQTEKIRLSRREKEELKAIVTSTLRRQLMPTMKVIDLSWNLDTGVVRFWNQSTRMHEILEDIFDTTFELGLVPDTPYTVASYAGLTQKHLFALTNLDPTPFHSKGRLLAEQAKAESIAALDARKG